MLVAMAKSKDFAISCPFQRIRSGGFGAISSAIGTPGTPFFTRRTQAQAKPLLQ
jgi:hypothetical protein